jgi:uncharacterized oligopeptide transporter (OPT) family protein
MPAEPADGDHERGKRPARLTMDAVAAGVGVGVLLCILNVLVVFRSGTPFGGAALAVLLGAAALRLLRRLDQPRLLIVFSVASSGYFATAAIDSGIAAEWLRTGRVPNVVMLIAVAIAANLAGIALGMSVANNFVDRQRLPYPTMQPAIALVDAVVSRKRGAYRVLIGAALIAMVAALAGLLVGNNATPRLPGAPPWLSLTLSPLLFGLGALIGPCAGLWLAAGAAYSAAVWHAQGDTVSYDVHLASPWIVALGVGLVIGQSVIGFVRAGRPMVSLVGKVTRRAMWRPVPRIALAAAVACVAVSLAWRPEISRDLGILAVGLVMVLLYVQFLNQAGGEVGFAPVAPVLYLAVLVFAALGLPSLADLIVASAICCAGIASVYYTFTVKVVTSGPAVARMPVGRIIWTQAAGSIGGAITGIAVVLLLTRNALLGGPGFPAPVAQAVNFVDLSARGSGTYTGSAGVMLAVGSGVGAILSLTPAQSATLGLGVLLPPAYCVTIALGGLARLIVTHRRPEWKASVDQAASGLIVGEGLIMVVVVLVRAALG